MEKCGPYVGMVTVQVAQVGLLIASKVAMASGMTTFTFACYSNAFASLLLLPISSFLYRSNPPPLLVSLVCGFLVLGFMGFLVQILGFTGLLYASATLSTSMLNLIPGFTFFFALLFRLEKFNYRSSTTLAKSFGTLGSIVGALVLTLYQGPAILGISRHSDDVSSPTLATSSAWLLGGLLFAIDSVVASLFIIAQALVLKKCPFELALMFFYSLFVAILSAIVSLVIEKDLSAWSLADKSRLISVIYSALFGNVFQVSIIMWCVRRKGPLFAAVFHPLGVIFAVAMGMIVLGESLYLGSIVGSIIVVVGFYSVMWGKANEIEEVTKAVDSNGKGVPLLGDNKNEA